MKFVYNNNEYNINEQYSFKDFTGHNLSNKENISGVIYASCFSQETPDSEIFPLKLEGVTFIKCNLSNVKIPDGNTIIDCNTTRFCCQNDLRDWEVDLNGKPTKLMNEKAEIRLGRSIDPKDIPLEKLKSLNEIKKAGV